MIQYLTIEEVIVMNYALIKGYSLQKIIGVKEVDALEMIITQLKQSVFIMQINEQQS